MKNLTQKVIQSHTYSKNILQLIDDFITIPEQQVRKNKNKVMKDIIGFFKFYEIEDFVVFDYKEIELYNLYKKCYRFAIQKHIESGSKKALVFPANKDAFISMIY